MKTSATVAGVLVASLVIAAPNPAFSQHSFLKSGEVDDKDVAVAYYNKIDPDNLRTNLDAWLEVNGYHDPANEIIEVRGHFIDGDLAFWRSISLVEDKRPGYEGNIAFTTANYSTETDAVNGTNPVSIVNMEYSPGPGGDRITKFYMFDKDDGRRVTGATFDRSGEPLHLPAACYACHGGDEGPGETNGTFLAFDLNTMNFGDTTQASLESGFKKLNEAVLRTDPTKATRKLIRGLYGGAGLPRSTQDLTYIPTGWMSEPEPDQHLISRDALDRFKIPWW